jgi:hypothetical protein
MTAAELEWLRLRMGLAGVLVRLARATGRAARRAMKATDQFNNLALRLLTLLTARALVVTADGVLRLGEKILPRR